MATRKVSVERYVEQVHDGSHYQGYLTIADTTLDYELVFAVPIPRLDDMEPAKDKEEIRRLFQLTVKRDNANIELTNDEYGFFFQMLVAFAVDTYNNPQIRASNEGLMGQMIRGKGPLATFGASVSIGFKRNGSYDFPPKLCGMLNASKFGCALTV